MPSIRSHNNQMIEHLKWRISTNVRLRIASNELQLSSASRLRTFRLRWKFSWTSVSLISIVKSRNGRCTGNSSLLFLYGDAGDGLSAFAEFGTKFCAASSAIFEDCNTTLGARVPFFKAVLSVFYGSVNILSCSQFLWEIFKIEFYYIGGFFRCPSFASSRILISAFFDSAIPFWYLITTRCARLL